MNLWGAIEGRVLRKASESALQRIVDLIQEAQEMKAPSQRFTDKLAPDTPGQFYRSAR